MADEIQVTSPPGGNGLNLKMGTKQLGITGPIVIPVICIALVGAIGWIRSADFKESLHEVNTHLQAIYARQEALRSDLQEQTKEMLSALRDNRDITGEKIQTLTTQTTELHHAMGTQTAELVRRFEQQTTELTQRLSILSYNVDRPIGERLPLNVKPESVPQLQPQGGR